MIALTLIAAVPTMAAASNSVANMRWARRVLIISASRPNDTSLVEQRRIMAGWRSQAEARDLSVVVVVGDMVVGSSDRAGVLRRHYKLPLTCFAAVLIGKDGSEKLRRTRPVTASVLGSTIDAMPMRRAGER